MTDSFVKATIITIGDELMIGQVIDTNSAWIAETLNSIGIWLHRRVAVGDNREEILSTLKEESARTDLIIITGGLGPTADDITKPVLCEYFGGSMVMNAEVLEHLRYMFSDIFKRPFTERNANQAMVPDICTILFNHYGTAPGMQFEKDNVMYFSLPGVPYEMQGIMRDHVLPRLKEKFTKNAILHSTIVTSGIGESYLADHISVFEESLPESFKIAYLPGNGLLRLRLTARGTDYEELNNTLKIKTAELVHLVAEWLVTDEDINMAQLISKLLAERKKTLGTAESCTGGYLAHLITAEPGSSAIYKGSIISYANSVKMDLLNVQKTTLEEFGAVSEQTVLEMAAGALRELDVDYIIATSGIMGPDGGTADKPAGTVWIAVGDKYKLAARKFHFRYNRMQNIRLAANSAFNELRKFISGQEN